MLIVQFMMSNLQHTNLTNQAISRLDEKLINQEFKSLLDGGCCKQKCYLYYTVLDISRLRKSFYSKNEQDQNQLILDFFHHQRFIHSTSYTINNVNVCQKSWLLCHGIGRTRFYRLKANYLKGERHGDTCRKEKKTLRDKSVFALNWLQSFADDCGDYPPDRSVESRVLPACYTMKAVWLTYKEWAENLEVATVSEDWFLQLWKTRRPNITISKNTRFTKCGLCTLLKDIMKTTNDTDLKTEMQQMRTFHNKQQMGERAKYMKHQLKAKTSPEKYLSLIIDGMDQAKTGLPHFLTRSKAHSSEFVKTHITGVISHGHKRSFYYIDLHDGPHDSNLTLTILTNVLTRLAKDGVLPPILYIQMDNCWRENKNQYLMAFFSYLVQIKIFKKIRLSYLLVGHTHEDIDSTFSNISTKLNVTNVKTLDALIKCIEDSFAHSPKVTTLKYILNFKEWMKDNIRVPMYHTEPHAYKFEENDDGCVGVSYKRFCMDTDWMELRPLLSHKPDGTPKFVKLDWAKQCPIDDIRANIKACSIMLSTCEIEWWERFLNDFERKKRYWDGLTEKQLETPKDGFLLHSLKPFNKAPRFEKITEDDNRRRSVANQILEKSQKEPKTKIGKYSKKEREEMIEERKIQ